MNPDLTNAVKDLTLDDAGRAAALLPQAYDALRHLAAGYLARGAAVTLQPTALVHEAYLRLASDHPADVRSATHFQAVAALAMRHVLIDHHRGRGRLKRGGDRGRVTLTNALAVTDASSVDALDLSAALGRLAEQDPRAARVVELRFFGGLTEVDTAGVLGVSERTVRNDWKLAQAWLRCALDGDATRNDR